MFTKQFARCGNVRGFLSNFGSRCASQNKSSGPLAALSFPNPAMDLIRMMDDITSSTFNPRVPFESMLHPMLSDVKETKDAFEFLVDAPGVKKDDVKVEVRKKNGMKNLHIFMERKGSTTTDTETTHRTERFTGKYHRWFPLPAEVKEDEISAKCTDGVLQVNVPKTTETALPADVKCIEVK